jgi:hypothetical protein
MQGHSLTEGLSLTSSPFLLLNISQQIFQKLVQHRKDEASLHRDGTHDQLSEVGQIHSLVLIDR